MLGTKNVKNDTVNKGGIDILESEILREYSKVLQILLSDRTTRKNIFWATDDYIELGDGFEYSSTIKAKSITGSNEKVIMPRVAKNEALQSTRIRQRAEVFTPSWVCNSQNNQVDDAWFQQDGVFNIEYKLPDGTRGWKTTAKKISFPKGVLWEDYVKRRCLEVACGEGPYIASRYDSVTGEFIPVKDRVGILDRKLRVVNENTTTSKEWLKHATNAYQSTYAYEWQGDNLLLAREAMLYTFIENYNQKFGKEPTLQSIQKIANVISWNVWQMDGTKCVVPNSCFDSEQLSQDLFYKQKKQVVPCSGCLKNKLMNHNGKYCIVKDWFSTDKDTGKLGRTMRFIDVMR